MHRNTQKDKKTKRRFFTTYATFFHTFLVYSKILRIFAPSFAKAQTTNKQY